MSIQEIKAWETSDGGIFSDYELALEHETEVLLKDNTIFSPSEIEKMLKYPTVLVQTLKPLADHYLAQARSQP